MGGLFLAATWIKPLHVNKGKTIAQTITDRTDYAENPDKTREGELVTAYQCTPRLADAEFLLSKKQYLDLTGRDQGKSDILAYHIRQSFKPGEITSELANKLGYELALRFTHGKNAFIVATHEDKHHIHCHIVFNSTNLDCKSKFRNPMRSNKIVRRISDQICLENGLSVIENPKPSRGHYGTWLGDQKVPTWHEKLEQLIDKILSGKPADFDDFLKQMEGANCKVSRKKLISLCMEGQKRPIRLKSLSADYTEDAIRERISGARVVLPKESPVKESPVTQSVSPETEERQAPAQPQKPNMLIVIQRRIKAINDNPDTQGAKIFNLKQVSKSLMLLQEKGLTEMDKLRENAQDAKDKYNKISGRVHDIDARLKDINTLQAHIGTYIKTKAVADAYKKSGNSKKFMVEHETELTARKEAKKYFDGLKLGKLPTIKILQQEYAELSAERKKLYAEQKPARDYMQEILTAEQNIKQFLNFREDGQGKENDRIDR